MVTIGRGPRDVFTVLVHERCWKADLDRGTRHEPGEHQDYPRDQVGRIKEPARGPSSEMPRRFVVFRHLRVIEVFYVEAESAEAARERVLPRDRARHGMEDPSHVAHVGPEKNIVKAVRRFPRGQWVQTQGGHVQESE